MLCFCSRYLPVIIVHVYRTLMKQYTIIQIYFLCMFILLWSCSEFYWIFPLQGGETFVFNFFLIFFFWRGGGGEGYWEFLSSLSMFICLDNMSFLFTKCAHFYSGQNGLFFNVTMSFIIFWDLKKSAFLCDILHYILGFCRIFLD